MNLNEQRCSVCNTKSDELTILQDGVLCQACRQLLSCFSTELAGRSIADVQDQLGRREANRQRVATFSPSRLVGPGDCLHIDDKHETFLFGFGRDFRDGNPHLFTFYQLRHVGLTPCSETCNGGAAGFDLTFHLSDPDVHTVNFRMCGTNDDVVQALNDCPSAIAAALQIMGYLELPTRVGV